MNKIFKVVFCKSTGTFVAVSENSKSQKKNTKSSKMCGIGKAVGIVLSTLLTQQAIAITSVIQGDTNLNTSSNYTSIFGVNNNVLPLLNGDEVTAYQIAQNHTLVAGSLNTSSGRNNTLLGAANLTIGNDSTSIGGTNYSEGNNNLSLSTTRTSTNNNMSDPMVAMYLSKVSKVYDELAALTQLVNEESKLTQVEIEANLLKLQTDGVISLNTYEGILAKGLTRQIASMQAVASLSENGMSLYNNTVGNANIALGDANYTGGNMNTTTGTYNKTSGSHNTINGLGNELSGDGNVVLGLNNISNGNENIVIGSQFSKELPEISAKYSDVIDRFLSGSITSEQYTAELEVLVREVGLMGSEVNLIQGNNNTVLGKINLVNGSSNQHIGSNGFISGKVNALVGEKLTVNGDYNSAIGSHTSVKGIGNTVNAQGLSVLTTQSVQSDATTNFFERMSQNGSTASMYQALQNKSLYQDVVAEYINAETGSNLQFENEILYDTVLGGGALLEQSDLYAAYRALTPEQIAELEVLAQERMTSFDAEYSVLMQEAQQRAADTGVTEYEAFVAVLEENGKLSALIDMQDVNTATIAKESTVVGDHVVGLGAGITVNADDAVAIGKEATVSHDGSVALGAGSTATGVTLPNEAYLVGGTATAEVNIGDRRITGLAAGSENTDAVNVAQLKEVSAAVEGITLKDLSSDSWHIEMGKNNSIAQLVDDQIHASNVIGSANTVTNPKDGLFSAKQQLNILGHGNSTDNSIAYNLIGNANRLNDSSFINVLGESNTVANSEASNVLGYGNTLDGEYNFANTVAGQSNKVLNNTSSLVAGLNNTVGSSGSGNAVSNSVVGTMLNVQGSANNVFGYMANTKGSFNVSFNSTNAIHALDDLMAIEQDPTKKALLQEYRDLSVANLDGKLSSEDYQDQIVDLLARDTENSITKALTPYLTNFTKTEGNYNVVMGTNNQVIGDGNLALGSGLVLEGDNRVALGNNTKVDTDGSVALGLDSYATGLTLNNEAYLVGGTASAEVNIGDRRITGLAAGAEDTDAVNVAQLKEVSTAVDGINLKDLSKDSWHVNLGKNSSLTAVDIEPFASVLVGANISSSSVSLIVGANNTNTTNTGIQNNIFGSNNAVNTGGVLVFGNNLTLNDAANSIFMGNNIKLGVDNPDINLEYAFNTIIGNAVTVDSVRNSVVGAGNKLSTSDGNLLSGSSAVLGSDNTLDGSGTNLIGTGIVANGNTNNVMSNRGAADKSILETISLSTDAQVLAEAYFDGDPKAILTLQANYPDEYAVFEKALLASMQAAYKSTAVTGSYNNVFGFAAAVNGDDNVGLGSNLKIDADNAVAIGSNATVSHDGSVALGAGSVASGLTLLNEAYLVGGTATAEMNIGNRRITGLAAGSNDSDAVNVEQLKSLAQNVENSVSTLNDRINLTDQNLAQYQTANDQKVNELEAGLSTTNQTIDQNKADTDAQIGDIQTGLNATNNTVAQNKIDADQKAGQLEAGLQSTNDQLNDLSAGLASTNDKVGALETGLAATNVKVGELEAGLADTNTQLGQTNDKIDQNQALNDAKFGELETGLASTNDKVGELQTGLADTNAQLGLTNDKIDQNQALNDAKFGELETGLASTNDKVGKLESGLADTNAKVDQNQALNDAKFGELETGLASTNDKVGELQTGLADTNTQLGLTNDKIDQNQALNDAKIGDIETGLADTNTQLGLTNDKIDQNQALNDAKIGDIESGLASTNDKVGEIETGLVDTNAKVDQNQATNDAKFGELETGLASTNDKVGELETDLADTNQSLETLKTETNTQIGNLDSELDKTQNDLQAAIENSVKYGQKDGDVDYSAVVLQGEDGSRITNLANGEQDSDAVNLGQVKNLIDSIGPGSLSGNVIQYDLNADGTVNKDSVVLGGESGTLITNVQEGKVEAGSTDAINGSQLNAVYSNLSSSLGGGASWNAETSTYTAPVYELSTGSYKGVDSALTALDAKDQALEGKINNLEQSFANQLNATDQNIRKVEKRLSAGIAQALSMESAPYVAGKLSYALGAAHYNGEQAIGGTLRLTAENGNWSVITGVSGASEGGAAFKIGMSGVFD